MKTCNKCKRDLDISFFGKNKRMVDGFQRTCKTCSKEYHSKWLSENAEARKQHSKKYRDANQQKINEHNRKYHELNKEKSREYYKANRDKIKQRNELRKDERNQYNRDWRKANPNKTKENNARYREENPEYFEFRAVVRRAGRGDKTALEIYGVPSKRYVKKIRVDKILIYNKYFDGIEKHLDHMKPLVEAKGDAREMHKRSHFTNLVYIPAQANMNKSAKPFWEWFSTIPDEKLKKCIAEQDAYNKKIHAELTAND